MTIEIDAGAGPAWHDDYVGRGWNSMHQLMGWTMGQRIFFCSSTSTGRGA